MSEEDAFHFDPNLVCEMEGLGQSPFPRELMTAYVSSLSRAHMPGAGNTLPLYPTCLPSLTQTRRELVYYQTFPDCKAECTNSAPWALPSSPESNEERTVTR